MMRFTDRADVSSTFRMQRTLERDIVVASLPPVEHGTMILFAHHMEWMVDFARAGGASVPVSLISAPLPPATTWRDWLWRPYVRLRWREMNQFGGAPF